MTPPAGPSSAPGAVPGAGGPGQGLGLGLAPRSPLWHWILGASAAAAVAVGTRHALRAALASRETFAAERDHLVLPRASVLRVLGLGHHEMLADLVAARANVYFGGALAGRAPDPGRQAQPVQSSRH